MSIPIAYPFFIVHVYDKPYRPYTVNHCQYPGLYKAQLSHLDSPPMDRVRRFVIGDGLGGSVYLSVFQQVQMGEFRLRGEALKLYCATPNSGAYFQHLSTSP
jgi:hypothetical protein